MAVSGTGDYGGLGGDGYGTHAGGYGGGDPAGNTGWSDGYGGDGNGNPSPNQAPSRSRTITLNNLYFLDVFSDMTMAQRSLYLQSLATFQNKPMTLEELRKAYETNYSKAQKNASLLLYTRQRSLATSAGLGEDLYAPEVDMSRLYYEQMYNKVVGEDDEFSYKTKPLTDEQLRKEIEQAGGNATAVNTPKSNPKLAEELYNV